LLAAREHSAEQGVLYVGVVGRGRGPGTAPCCWRRCPGSLCQPPLAARPGRPQAM